ncbi:transmembrane protein 230-like [Saccoglossus kowalevskii]|uniref:Transmembrane protein 230 n=1 Tax=Saccoglossus kowalevskii TaxID=10224 RepID=A0ABM0GSH8_SACKO|nr:PREDICTED: transmembrane protein 230-like [Saccoglossus kowalevskii]
MMPAKNAKNGNSYKYRPMQDPTKMQDGFTELQFRKPPVKVPLKAIGLAVFLFVVGSALIIVGSLLLSGYIDSKYSDRTWPVLILGVLVFIPGFYHVRIAYYAYKGYRGYSYEDIPNFDD